MAGKIQNADIKSLSELTTLGATKTELLNTSKMYTLKSDEVLETTLRKNNFTATVDPTISNDVTQNYEVGSRWSNTTTQKEYYCVSNSTGAAVWKAVASDGGVGGVDIMATDTAENAALTDYTQTGLEILSTPVILHGTKTFRLIHQAASTRSFKKVIAVDRKFRGKTIAVELDVVSSALMANLTILFRNETVPGDIGTSQQIQTDSISIGGTTTNASNQLTAISQTDINKLKLGMIITGAGIQSGTTITGISPGTLSATLSQNATAGATITAKISALTTKRKFSFLMPENCASFSWTISALQEAGLPETYLDDILFQLAESAKTSASFTVPVLSASLNVGPMVIGAVTTAPTLGATTTNKIQSRQIGDSYEFLYELVMTAAGSSGSGDYLLNLPSGLQFDPARVVFSTGAVLSIAASVGTGHITNGSSHTIVSIIPYNATQFRVLAPFNGTSTFWSNSNFALTGATAFACFITAPILNASATETKTIALTSHVLSVEPDSILKLTGGTVTGSGLITYTTINENKGDAFSVNIATGVITILKDGLFTVSASGTGTGTTGAYFQVNGVQYPGYSLSAVAGQRIPFATSFYLNKNDQIAWTNPSSGSIAAGEMVISYVGKTKILNPSSDQKIEIPTHSLRFEGSSSRGSTDTAVVKFDTMTKIKGDAWDVVNSAANGTVVTMKKAGQLLIDTNIYVAVNTNQVITLNATALNSFTRDASVLTEVVGGSGSLGSQLSAVVEVKVGDKIRVISTITPTSLPTNSLNLTLIETQVQVALSNVLPQWNQSDSAVLLNTANGWGSTNTRIRRFSNNPTNFGTAITYTDSASLGGVFLINEDGDYSITFSDEFVSADYMGISLNTSVPTVSIQNIPASEVLAMTVTQTGNNPNTLSWSGPLTKGDIIRAHTSSSAAGTTPSRTKFTISKAGKPNLSSVDVTPFVNIKTQDTEAIECLTPTLVFGSVNTGVPVLNVTKNSNLGVIKIDSNSANGTSFTVLKNCELQLNVSVGGTGSGTGSVWITRNGNNFTSFPTVGILNHGVNVGNGNYFTLSASAKAFVGDIIRVQRDVTTINEIHYLTLLATADSDTIATATKNISSDTMNFNFKSTAITDADPVGTFNTFTYTAGSNSTAISPSAPTQSVASMMANGFQIFGRGFGSAGASTLPSRVEIKIGKNLEAYQVQGYSGTGKTGPGIFDLLYVSVNRLDGTSVYYNKTTGILTIDAGFDSLGSVTTRYVLANENAVTAAYFTISASAAPSIVAIPNLNQRIAYIKDNKAPASHGGTFTAGAWQTRDLNNVQDLTGIVKSLASNAFTLDAGTYEIDATVPAYQVGAHMTKLAISGGADILFGTSGYAVTGGSASEDTSRILGQFTISTTTTFVIQHRGTTSVTTLGFGVSNGFANETYTAIKLTKIK